MTTKQYHPPLPDFAAAVELFSFWPNYEALWPSADDVDRICVDRLLLIRERLIDLGLQDRSVLDLGGGSGFFSWMLYLTAARSVDLVEDERARRFGYGEQSFTSGLEARIAELKIRDLVVHKESIEDFLAAHAERSTWDVTLCLSVLHHFVSGYGDDRNAGRMEYEDLIEIFRRIGAVTRRCLYLEVDPERIPNYEEFMSDLLEEGQFNSMSILGKSHSSIGVARNMIELRKT